MKIQLLYFPSCPNYEAARESLGRCLAARGLDLEYEMIDVTGPDTAAELSGWGSPTILVNGVDAGGRTTPEGATSCRLYSGAGRPADDQIIALLVSEGRDDAL